MRRAINSCCLALGISLLLSCQPAIRLAGFGDSITGWQGWLTLMGPIYNTENYGVTAELSWDGVDRLIATLPTIDADVITIMWGTNDVLLPSWTLDQTIEPLTEAVDAVLAAGITPILLVPPPMFRNTTVTWEEANDRLYELQGAIHSLGVVRGVEVGHIYMTFWLHPDIPDNYQALYKEGIHPNWTGHAVIRDVVDASIMAAMGWDD